MSLITRADGAPAPAPLMARTGGAGIRDVPAVYWTWLGGLTVSMLGTRVLGFALAWAAAERSGALAGVVLACVTVPGVVLALLGGAVSDRVGVWRIGLTTAAAKVVTSLGLAVGIAAVGAQAWLLIVAGLTIGTISAFDLPSSATVPRRLVDGPALVRATSARMLCGQLAAFVGAPVAGLIIVGAGLELAVALNAVASTVMIVVLAFLARRFGDGRVGAEPGRRSSTWHDIVSGLRVVRDDPVLRPVLVLTAFSAGLLGPLVTVLVPVLAQERGWSAAVTGWVVGSLAVGTAAAVLWTMVRPVHPRPGVVAIRGALVESAAVAALAVAPSVPSAVLAAGVLGFGSGLMLACIAPLILAGSPPSHLARTQSIASLGQSVPLLVGGVVLGALTDLVGAAIVVGGCAVLMATAVVTIRVRSNLSEVAPG